MSADGVPSVPRPSEGLEIHRSHELVRDEDVLSQDAQHALADVGTALGVILAAALFVAHIARARRLLSATISANTDRSAS